MGDVALSDEDNVLEPGFILDGVDQRGEDRVYEARSCPRVAQDVDELLRREAEVEGIDHAAPEEPSVIELQVLRRVESHNGEPVGALETQTLQTANQMANPVEVLGIGGRESGRCVGGAGPVRISGDGWQQ